MPEHTDTELHMEVEFNHIKASAAANCLHLNLSKTKEMVFRQPRITYFHLPPAVGDIEQVIAVNYWELFFSLILKWTRMYTTSSPCSVLSVCICLNFCGIRVCRVNSYQWCHILYYCISYMLYQRGADFCLPSLRIRSMPFLGASTDLVARLATLQCQIW